MNFLKNFLFLTLFFQVLFVSLAAETDFVDPAKKAVTYDPCGRFGNHLIEYLVAKWIAHQNNLPLLYVPFKHSEKFIFHEAEPFLRKQWEPKFKNLTMIKDVAEIPQLEDSTVVLLNFFCTYKNTPNVIKIKYRTFWDVPEFREFGKQFLQPKNPVETLKLPKNKLSVLVHVRTGGGHDSRATQLRYPTKFPPESFYIYGLKTISELFGHAPIYAFVMTDDLYVAEIGKRFQEALTTYNNIEIDYRKGLTGPSMNMLEDFFSIPKFDCLIRGSSTFSIAASLLGDYKAVISMKEGKVKNDEIVVKEVVIQEKGKNPKTVSFKD